MGATEAAPGTSRQDHIRFGLSTSPRHRCSMTLESPARHNRRQAGIETVARRDRLGTIGVAILIELRPPRFFIRSCA